MGRESNGDGRQRPDSGLVRSFGGSCLRASCGLRRNGPEKGLVMSRMKRTRRLDSIRWQLVTSLALTMASVAMARNGTRVEGMMSSI